VRWHKKYHHRHYSHYNRYYPGTRYGISYRSPDYSVYFRYRD
jgi:hypothetical protein